MKYQYNIRLTFRNKKILSIDCNILNNIKDGGSSKNRLWIDGKPCVRLKAGSPNMFTPGEFYLYNATPVKANLFEYFPEDWDKTDPQFNIIDVVLINTKGIQKHE